MKAGYWWWWQAPPSHSLTHFWMESELLLRTHKLISLSQEIAGKQAGLVHSITFVRRESIPLQWSFFKTRLNNSNDLSTHLHGLSLNSNVLCSQYELDQWVPNMTAWYNHLGNSGGREKKKKKNMSPTPQRFWFNWSRVAWMLSTPRWFYYKAKVENHCIRPVLLQVWSPDQQHRHHPGT